MTKFNENPNLILLPKNAKKIVFETIIENISASKRDDNWLRRRDFCLFRVGTELE